MMRNDTMKRMFLVALALVALACLAGPTWAASQFGGGSGTEEDPYRIKTRAHLAAMHDDGTTDWTKGKWFRLDEDIDLDGKAWTPIDFKGRFDGNGHAVIGLKVAVEGDGTGAVAGLFGHVSDGAMIKGLTVHGSVSAKDDQCVRAGGVAGQIHESAIEGCDFVGTVEAEAGDWATAGGVAGEAYATAVKGCTASGSASAESKGTGSKAPGAAAGGIVGTFVGTDKAGHVLEDCVSDVKLEATGGSGQKTGGVAATYHGVVGSTAYPPSGNRWYGKGASAGVNLGSATVTGETFTPSDEGARKGTGSAVLSRWLPEGKVGKLYDAQVIVAGSATKVEVSKGALPDGLGLVGTKISGIPMETGTSKFTLTAGSSSQKVSINVENATSPVSITTTELQSVKVGEEFRFQLGASGATAPAKWSVTVGLLPEGASLSEGGVLSGTVAETGTWPFTVMVVDSKGFGATQALTLTVASEETDPDDPDDGTYAIKIEILDPAVGSAVTKVDGKEVTKAVPGTKVQIVVEVTKKTKEDGGEYDGLDIKLYYEGVIGKGIPAADEGSIFFIMPAADATVKISISWVEADNCIGNMGFGVFCLPLVPLLALRRRKR